MATLLIWRLGLIALTTTQTQLMLRNAVQPAERAW